MIRTVSLCLIRKGDNILVQEIVDPVVKQTFYRPIGGTVEYGENSKDTIIREVKEEIDAEIKEPKLLFVIENIFAYLDDVGHEVDFIYEAELVERSLYDNNEIQGIEGATSFKAVWKSIHELSSLTSHAQAKLVPDGLLNLLLSGTSEPRNPVGHYRSRSIRT
ncbi:NUDIX domain-containing protein [Paenibacillus amylolyticus]|uniref:NUDIX hydrolase n=1 Tax=Paenibacillus amylolyticus TaxID=1451 RepID=UPI00286CBA1E|nr:NUDIX domain-containing protein [Paenibacillus amylolyticus]